LILHSDPILNLTRESLHLRSMKFTFISVPQKKMKMESQKG
jgi:hypothetical protein